MQKYLLSSVSVVSNVYKFFDIRYIDFLEFAISETSTTTAIKIQECQSSIRSDPEACHANELQQVAVNLLGGLEEAVQVAHGEEQRLATHLVLLDNLGEPVDEDRAHRRIDRVALPDNPIAHFRKESFLQSEKR